MKKKESQKWKEQDGARLRRRLARVMMSCTYSKVGGLASKNCPFQWTAEKDKKKQKRTLRWVDLNGFGRAFNCRQNFNQTLKWAKQTKCTEIEENMLSRSVFGRRVFSEQCSLNTRILRTEKLSNAELVNGKPGTNWAISCSAYSWSTWKVLIFSNLVQRTDWGHSFNVNT